MLSREDFGSSRKYTNANGRTIYGECESQCYKTPIELDDIYEEDDKAKKL